MTTPPNLTQTEYLAFLNSLPVHPSCLCFAVGDGNVEEVKEILMSNPNLDVNWKDDAGWSALYIAFEKDCDSVVSILLAHPDINVNLKVYGSTAFKWACQGGRTSRVRLLLKDQRVGINKPDYQGHTPLWDAACNGHLDIIKWWLVSGREMDLGYQTDVIGVAKRRGETEVVTLLNRFKEKPNEIRHQVRLEICWYDEAAAEIFALVVFVSDELLQFKDTTPTPAARFLSITRRLPLELQMIICHRVVGSPKEIIPGKESEVAFKSLTGRLLWSSYFAS